MTNETIEVVDSYGNWYRIPKDKAELFNKLDSLLAYLESGENLPEALDYVDELWDKFFMECLLDKDEWNETLA